MSAQNRYCMEDGSKRCENKHFQPIGVQQHFAMAPGGECIFRLLPLTSSATFLHSPCMHGSKGTHFPKKCVPDSGSSTTYYDMHHMRGSSRFYVGVLSLQQVPAPERLVRLESSEGSGCWSGYLLTASIVSE